jgi:hypothetical protein
MHKPMMSAVFRSNNESLEAIERSKRRDLSRARAHTRCTVDQLDSLFFGE